MSKSFSSVVVLTVLYAFSAYGFSKFSYRDCAPQNAPMHLYRLEISPHPVEFPGNLTITVDGATNGNVSHSSVHVILKKKHALFGVDIPVPCLNHIGSCNYTDICTILHDMEAGNWGYGLLAHFAQQIKSVFSSRHQLNALRCPFTSGHLQLTNYVAPIPPVPSAYHGLVAGDWYLKVDIVEHKTNRILFCIEVDVSLSEVTKPNSGIGNTGVGRK